jgi:hypothetical protein
MATACSAGEMAVDHGLTTGPPKTWRCDRCDYCQAEAEPPLFLSDPRARLPDRCFCDRCWLLLEIGFSDAHPYDDLYRRLSSVEAHLSDADVGHYILRGWVLLRRSRRLTP